MASPPRRLEVGSVFGRLTVIKDDRQRTALCQCACGSEPKEVMRTSLRYGSSKSCGCEFKPKAGHNKKHGLASTPEYIARAAMIGRCTHANHPSYQRYGGRGISVCARWRIFENFLADMGPRRDGLSLDRTDNSIGYEPGNCKWVSHKEQCVNTSKSKRWTVDGVEFLSSTDAGRYFGVSGRTITGWCDGYTVNGKAYPPRSGCSSRLAYPGMDEAELQRAVDQTLAYA